MWLIRLILFIGLSLVFWHLSDDHFLLDSAPNIKIENLLLVDSLLESEVDRDYFALPIFFTLIKFVFTAFVLIFYIFLFFSYLSLNHSIKKLMNLPPPLLY